MFEVVGALPIAQLAKRIGLKVSRSGIGPCPECGSAHRGSADKRPPITHGRQSWRCWACGARGDGVGLVAAVLVGGQPARGDREGWRRLWGRVEEVFGSETRWAPKVQA